MPSLLLRKPGVALASAFYLDATTPAVSNVNFSTVAYNNTNWHSAGISSTGAQNAEVVYGLDSPLRGGTWALSLLIRTSTDRGIVTIATSPDGVTFTDLTTYDAYAGVNNTTNRALLTGLTMPQGTRYLRLKVADKNASASTYNCTLQGIAGTRTGA